MLTFKQYLIEANLSQAQLYKYDWRVDMFINKLKAGEPFELISGEEVTLVPDPDVIDVLRRKGNLRGIELETEDGEPVKFSDIKKTGEFGGVGSTTTKEDKELESLNNQIVDIMSETGRGYVRVRVDGVVHRVAAAETTPGTPKSDFHLIDDSGREVVWISHKDGSTAKDFQQWGGMTEEKIKNHPEVQQFATDVYEMFSGKIPKQTTVARPIRSNNLKKYSVYGVDYGSNLGRQNVSVLLQGPVSLVKRGRLYELDANNVHYNGETMKGDFVPVLMAIYKGDRSNFGVKGARFAIQPKGSRKVHEWI